MTYAIVSLGGKQYRVSEGQKLLVDRLREEEGATFTLSPLLVGGNGETQLGAGDVTVTAKVVGHVLGKKIRIGKYRPKNGFRRHTGFRSRLSHIQIEKIGSTGVRRSKSKAAAEPPSEDATTGS